MVACVLIIATWSVHRNGLAPAKQGGKYHHWAAYTWQRLLYINRYNCGAAVIHLCTNHHVRYGCPFVSAPGHSLNIKLPSYWYRKFLYKDKAVLWTSLKCYHHTWKYPSLHWNGIWIVFCVQCLACHKFVWLLYCSQCHVILEVGNRP